MKLWHPLPFKIIFFIVLTVVIVNVNGWLVEGPLLQANNERSLHQMKDDPFAPEKQPIISMNAVYVIELMAFVYLAIVLFSGDIARMRSNSPPPISGSPS